MPWGVEAGFEDDNFAGIPLTSGTDTRARPLGHYFHGFAVICRRLLRHVSFESAALYRSEGVVFNADGSTPTPTKENKSFIDQDSDLPFWMWLRVMISLQYNPEVRGTNDDVNPKLKYNDDGNEDGVDLTAFDRQYLGLPWKGLLDKFLSGLVVATGVVEATLFSIARMSMVVVDGVDHVIFKPTALAVRKAVGLQSDADVYGDRNTWLATGIKGLISVFTLPVLFVWHFAVSKPLSIAAYAENRWSKILYIMGLLLIVGLVIGFTCGLGSVPIFGAALAKMSFIQLAGDAVAAGFSSVLAPLTTAAFAESIGLYFSWVTVLSIWKIFAAGFLNIINCVPVLKEHSDVRRQLKAEEQFNKEAGFNDGSLDCPNDHLERTWRKSLSGENNLADASPVPSTESRRNSQHFEGTTVVDSWVSGAFLSDDEQQEEPGEEGYGCDSFPSYVTSASSY